MDKKIPVQSINMYARMVEHFGGCILWKKLPRISARDAELNMRAMDACFESARTGRAIKI